MSIGYRFRAYPDDCVARVLLRWIVSDVIERSVVRVEDAGHVNIRTKRRRNCI